MLRATMRRQFDRIRLSLIESNSGGARKPEEASGQLECTRQATATNSISLRPAATCTAAGSGAAANERNQFAPRPATLSLSPRRRPKPKLDAKVQHSNWIKYHLEGLVFAELCSSFAAWPLRCVRVRVWA